MNPNDEPLLENWAPVFRCAANSQIQTYGPGRIIADRSSPLDSFQSKARIGLLTWTDAAETKLDMDLLSERAAMLADVRDEVSAMKRVPAEILSEVRVSR